MTIAPLRVYVCACVCVGTFKRHEESRFGVCGFVFLGGQGILTVQAIRQSTYPYRSVGSEEARRVEDHELRPCLCSSTGLEY